MLDCVLWYPEFQVVPPDQKGPSCCEKDSLPRYISCISMVHPQIDEMGRTSLPARTLTPLRHTPSLPGEGSAPPHVLTSQPVSQAPAGSLCSRGHSQCGPVCRALLPRSCVSVPPRGPRASGVWCGCSASRYRSAGGSLLLLLPELSYEAVGTASCAGRQQ